MNQPGNPSYRRRLDFLLSMGLLILTAIFVGAGVTDLADSPDDRAQFLDAGWERGIVDGRWWIFFFVAMLAYAVRLRLVFLTTRNRRTLRWITPIEILVIALLSIIIALGLSWNSVVN